jgi:hypothetical protein
MKPPLNTPLTISWFNQQNQMKTIDLSPKFQRHVVWSTNAQAYLIDTLLRELSIPKVYIKEDIDDKGNSTYRVVDGQQRLTAIFEFLNGNLVLQDKYSKDLGLGGKKFTEIPADKRKKFYEYPITVDMIRDASDAEIKDMFTRLNRTGAKLNHQELRHAAYEGDFIQLVEEIAQDPYWDKIRMFATQQIRRMLDFEYISELLMMVQENKMIDRKRGLDKFYADNEVMGDVKKKQLKAQFQKVLGYMKRIATDRSTRFVNRGDFYSLFYTLHYFAKNDYVFHRINMGKIKQTLSFLTVEISPRSGVPRFTEYYNSTQEAVDSFQNRNLRFEILRDLFEPMMAEKRDARRNFTLLQKQIVWNKSSDKECSICGKVVGGFEDYEPDHIKSWQEGGRTEIGNGRVAHRACNRGRR